MPEDFWVVFIANLPLLAALFWALQKKWIIMGVTFEREITDLKAQIDFREKLRQEAINDLSLLRERDREKTDALRELTSVVDQTLKLNDRLLSEALDQRWDGNDRRSSSRTTR